MIGNKLFSRLFPYPQYMVCTEERGHAASPGAAECPWHYTRCVGLCFAYHLCGLTLWMCMFMFYGADSFSLSLVPVARPLSHTIREVSLWKRRRALQWQQVHTFSGRKSVIESIYLHEERRRSLFVFSRGTQCTCDGKSLR